MYEAKAIASYQYDYEKFDWVLKIIIRKGLLKMTSLQERDNAM